MPRAVQPRGRCMFCGYETTKGAMGRHIAKCPQRLELVAAADRSKRKPETLHLLRVQDGYGPGFWLDLEVRGTATLKDIDTYLRAIWLECCGHLSEFLDGERGGDEISMTRKVDAVFKDGTELTHIYDFGTSSETKIKEVGRREGVPLTAKPITLMVRNLMPTVTCLECGKPATHLCLECIYVYELSGMLCDAHAEEHDHVDYGEPMQLFNSPRMGMCGYDGPAEPPY